MSTILENLSLESDFIATRSDLRGLQCTGPRVDQFLKQTFPQLFAAQVTRQPEQVAVVSQDAQLTYGELNDKANQLARALRNRGVGRESLVGICVDRSLDMAVGILGILKAGAAYLPLDPDYPAERLAWLLTDSKVSVVLTKAELAATIAAAKPQVNLSDIQGADVTEMSTANLDECPEPKDLAYVIYTSGSTGDPKGVMIEHANLGNYLLALQLELQLDPGDRYLHTASISFSSSRRQLLLPLSQGATVVIATAEQRKDPFALFAMIKQREVTVMDAVPSFWRSCTEALASLDDSQRTVLLDNRLRLMLSASEPLLSNIPQTWMHRFGHPARHVHMFGQTETAGIVCTYQIPENYNDYVETIPIGRPIANTQIYILDEHKQPVPPGAPGELYIGGAGVGRGYLNRPDVSAQKFISHSVDGQRAVRLYRTGDFARLAPNGSLEFTGRQDSQVKVRGFRVELGEIEAMLAHHPGVKDNVVVARAGNSGTKELIAYFVARETVPSSSQLRAFLNARLPDYMVPANFIELSTLPLTANGKIDKRALPEPDKSRPTLSGAYEAPARETEKRVEQIWANVLHIDRIGVNDDFFELGGHSLLAIQVMARINGQFRITVPLRTLFECSTIRKLSAAVDALANSAATTEVLRIPRDQPLALSFAQQRLWFIDQLEAGSALYNINKALRLRGRIDASRLNRAVQNIAARHEILRTTFVAHDGEPVQLIAPAIEIPFRVEDLRLLDPTERHAEVNRLSKIETERPFDLSCGPLLRVNLFRLADDEHVLLLSIHHIIADAWALKIFFTELASFYESQDTWLPPLPVQYADFAAWQRKNTNGAALVNELSFWRTQLQDAPFSLNLPSDFPVPSNPSFLGARESVVLPEHLYRALRGMCRHEGVTLFMLLLSAFQILLSIYSGVEDVLVGTPVAGRDLIEAEPLIGCFINTLVLRGNLSGDPTYREVLGRTRETAINAYTHQSVPFEKLVEELRPERSLNRSPLFQTMFVLENEAASELQLKGVEVNTLPVQVSTAKFDLTLGATEKASSLEIWISYSTELFEHKSITAILGDFQQTLATMVANPDQRVSQIAKLRWQPKVPAAVAAETSAAQQEKPKFVAPRTPIEERLVAIWTEVLRVDQVGVLDNFFELGGHSLLAAQVISRARTALSVELPLRRMFETPTVAGLAKAIYEMQTAETEDEELAKMLAELSQLSEEEAQRKFAEEF